jgi:iron complex outermembrane receptor protein
MNKLSPARAQARRSLSTALCVLLLSVLPVAPLTAQTAPASAVAKDEVVELSRFNVSASSSDRYLAGEAVSAVRVRSALIDTPSSISVITRDMMDDLAPNRVFDVTRYIAGVQEGRGIQFQDRMIIRGFETQNGARTVDSFLQSADADNIEEAVIDRIEVTKGPNAILSPAGAPGGSLNVITKSPLYRRQRSVTAQLGLFDAQKVTLDLSGPFAAGSPFAYRLVGSYQNTRRYWSADAKLKGTMIAPMFSWRLAAKTMLTVKLVAAEHWIFREPLLIIDPSTTAATADPKLLPGINPRGLNGIQPWSHVGTHSADLFTVLTTELTEHLSLRAAANGRYYFEDSDQNFLNAPNFANRYNVTTGELTQDQTWALQNTSLPYNASTNPYVPTASPWINPANIANRGDIQDTRRKTANLQVDLAGEWQLGAVSTQTVAGAACSRQYAYNQTKSAALPGINLAAPAYAYPAYPAGFTANNGSSYTNTQLFVSERLGLFDNRLYLSGGLLNYSSVLKNWNELTHVTTGTLDDGKTMWSAGALFKVTDKVSVYYSRSTNGNPAIVNTTQALWRDGEQEEFGFKTEFLEKRLSFNASFFKISQTNVTVPNPAYQTDPTQPQTLVSDLSNKGCEFELMGRLTPNLSAIATYAHLKMRDALGRMVRAVADDNAALLLSYRFTEGDAKGLSFSGGFSYSGKRAGDSATDGGNFTQLGVVKKVSFYVKPQYVTTLGAAYRLNETFTFRLNIDNVLDDKDYISVAGGRITGTGLTTQPGRNIRLNATIGF